jgi:epoxyqueuosine reductase QueG
LAEGIVVIKDKIIKKAEELRFRGTSFVDVEPFSEWKQCVDTMPGFSRIADLEHDPKKVLPEAKSIIVLLLPYELLKRESEPHYLRYFMSTVRGQFLAAELAKYIHNLGHKAVANPPVPQKPAALRTGGKLGKSSLYIHDALGTIMTIHVIITDACEPDTRIGHSECLNCGKCISSCPVGALPGKQHELCIRHHMDYELMPEWMRDKVSGLLGCGICQDVCPHNAEFARIDPSYDEKAAFELRKLLRGESGEAQKYIGEKYAEPSRLAGHAALYTGSRKLRGYDHELKNLSKSDMYPASEYAKWALAREGVYTC